MPFVIHSFVLGLACLTRAVDSARARYSRSQECHSYVDARRLQSKANDVFTQSSKGGQVDNLHRALKSAAMFLLTLNPSVSFQSPPMRAPQIQHSQTPLAPEVICSGCENHVSRIRSRCAIMTHDSGKDKPRKDESIVIVGGGVSGIWSALTLSELGYDDVTLVEKELRVGGKAAAFEYAGKKYPIGAVGTPLALESASFTESKLFEKPGRFVCSLLGRVGRRLLILDANNLVRDGDTWPNYFPGEELLSTTPVEDWKSAFGAKGPPERFYAHNIDFTSADASELATDPLPSLVPRWGKPQSSWPLVYVSAHGYGVAEADDVPPFYYWLRFAQKSTNAGAGGPLAWNIPREQIFTPYLKKPIGPRGPALRGWDSTTLFEQKLAEANIKVRTGVAVEQIQRAADRVTVTTSDGRAADYDRLVLAADLKSALRFLDVDEQERSLFESIVHQPYFTVASFIEFPWLASGKVYYLGDKQAPTSGVNASDAGRATGGAPLILLKPNRGSNLAITWAYGGDGIGPKEIEDRLRETVVQMGGRFNGVLFIKEWADYFPHVPKSELANNFHKRLDDLQGQKRTYMVGEVFNLPLVSECVDWARYLIRREFTLNEGSRD